ncbi:hypothetical protein HK105_208410 [Polyrhizophydium stewartii]|uniref:Phytocyanin domain-containing protein n=1 Tax=Polyrhizophydium stewartii TaxID=2732419 RepID=A0ABR4MXV2_9FUNG|nr:hypothetical protein HK105_005494 [Polyrhizophydium stewartii]
MFAAIAALALAAQAQAAVTHAIATAGLAYNIPDITIALGDSVTWSFGASAHTVTQVTDGTTCTNLTVGGFDSKQLVAPNTFTHLFDKPGDFWYICTVGAHCTSGMRGVVRVTNSITPVPQPTRTSSAAPTGTTLTCPAGYQPGSSSSSSSNNGPSTGYRKRDVAVPAGCVKAASASIPNSAASLATVLGAVALSLMFV